jgi:hypothetical protein
MPANLTYYIREGTLVGLVEGRIYNLEALSGGGGGSLTNRTTSAVNNPYMEGLKTAQKAKSPFHVHGGPIPPGTYSVDAPARHPHLGLSARLNHPRFKPMGRDGFFIHGRGPHGSDGCIVVLNHVRFVDLMAMLTKSQGGTLVVAESADGTRFA